MQETQCDVQVTSNGGQSPTIISDSESESYDSTDLEYSMDTDDMEGFFNPETDAFIQKCLLDDKLRLHGWLLQFFRKCRMMSEIYHLQKNSTNPYQPKIRENVSSGNKTEILATLLSQVKERNRQNKTSFYIFRELSEFLNSTRNLALLDSAVYSKICYIFEEFSIGPSLEPENYRILQNYHRARYMARNENIGSIFAAWKRSHDYDPQIEHLMLYERKFTEGLLYGPVMFRLETMLEETASVIPTIMEIASFDITQFKRFLEKFNISYSGPYKKLNTLDGGPPKMIFYVSSMNPGDSLVNGGLPLYGCYEFKPSSLNKTCQETSLQYINSLDFAPYWLTVIPPIFNESLAHFQKNLLGF